MPRKWEEVWETELAPVEKYIEIGPFKGGQNVGVTIPYIQAATLSLPLRIHPLLECMPWMPKITYPRYISWNVVEFPVTAMIKERFQPATSPKVEELHLLHDETGWSIRIANRLGVNVTDVLTGIFDFFASPLAVRVMEQQYFEKREYGFYDTFLGYRKSDALLNKTYFDGIRYDPDEAFKRLNYRATNVMVLSLNNC
ncbi:hypothetical protein BD324DRAFT_651367 [Kockovaella imperatae]|uniref:DUF6699 domain-containing protein n=1 Tax=Kockovaella imperatae TaxID=4999 RepID=A0A1Y1UFU9_9TREE|nr:hypothetical protein BD324DRAFT_651367 [Kockovaella imperatae]ORX36892.1 hypothetical protein BD324DRAFT_651367 [Kockovaella imperatae]